MFEGRKRRKLEKRRREALCAIRGELLLFDEMVQRPRDKGDAAPNDTLLKKVHDGLAEVQKRANEEIDIDEFEHLEDDAETYGQQRAYACPAAEIRTEGCLAIDLMEEWGVPKDVIEKLRQLLVPLLQHDDKTDVMRGALRAVFEESDSWRRYTDEYEDEMKRLTIWWLFLPAILLLPAAGISLHFARTLPLGILLAGAAGSCVSVMAKMPVLEIGLSGELESYERRILSRIGAGIIASLIGSGLLGWGVVSIAIQGKTFADVINECCNPGSSTALHTLILLAVPMLFGFSERALTEFELKVFGGSRRLDFSL
jgi:hypothetical protein